MAGWRMAAAAALAAAACGGGEATPDDGGADDVVEAAAEDGGEAPGDDGAAGEGDAEPPDESGAPPADDGEGPDEGDAPPPAGPWYFIAVHNEPNHQAGGEARIAESYEVLRGIVADATARHVKLTLMFAAQWAAYVTASPERLAEVRGWEADGHELAAHHHGVYHGSWDGYSDRGEAAAQAERVACGHVPPEPYLGTLDDYMAAVRTIDPDIVSACANDEADKSELPDGILYDTCSGFANHGAPGTDEGDNVASKGVNGFASTGIWDGVERTWLAHYQVYQDVAAGRAAFDGMEDGVYGAVIHSNEEQAARLVEFTDFLAERDPGGTRSLTVSEAVERGLLAERVLDPALLAEVDRPASCTGEPACGDGICDDFERAHPDACPEDCP